MASAAGLTAVGTGVRRRKLDELLAVSPGTGAKTAPLSRAALPPGLPAKAADGPSCGYRRAGMAAGADPANTNRMPRRLRSTAAAQGMAPDDEAELERRLRELEEELQSLLDIAGGTEDEASR